MVIAQLRHFQLATSGAQLLLFVLAAQLESQLAWLICLPLMAALSLLAWLAALKKYRTIGDTPTSKIASAAQGYVELLGTGDHFVENQPVISQLGRGPCLWYRYSIEEKDHDGDWHTVESGESDASFLLRDGTGECAIDPAGAEIITEHKKTWGGSRARYNEWLLLRNDALYVLGSFQTESGATAAFDAHAEQNALLASWKENLPELHARFDLNGDGVLDEQEWLLARRAARREVAHKEQSLRAQGDAHVLRQPSDGKMFVISNLPPEKLARRYLYWVWGNLFLFFAGLAGFAWVLQHPTQ